MLIIPLFILCRTNGNKNWLYNKIDFMEIKLENVEIKNLAGFEFRENLRNGWWVKELEKQGKYDLNGQM